LQFFPAVFPGQKGVRVTENLADPRKFTLHCNMAAQFIAKMAIMFGLFITDSAVSCIAA
jgi:hypothetical protein